MKKSISLIALGMSLASAIVAAPLSPQQALDRLNSGGPAKMRGVNVASYKYDATVSTPSGTPAAYVFTQDNKPGFILLGADELSAPMLGYSDSGSFDIDNCPPALRWWILEYGRQAEFANVKGSQKSKAVYAPAEWSAIEPLLKTTWDQGAPYNAMCPKINSQATYTGCVATSFAQVMNYFKYPEIGKGAIKYTSGSSTYFMGFDKTPFDWDNMLDSYSGKYTQEQADAVAYLMKACGYSVEMAYGTDASGAASYKLATAAVQYFGYDPAIRFEDRNYYSSDTWSSMIYNNLKNVGPVIYNGSAIDGGHSFVCDGYDGHGYFHINWGWAGNSNGYYLLDNLTPEIQGAGGASGGFNWSQDALLGMQKPTGQAYEPTDLTVTIYGTVAAIISDNKISFEAVNSDQAGWANAGYQNINLKLGAMIESPSGEKTYVDAGLNKLAGNITLTPGRLYTCPATKIVSQMPAGLADGKYKVTLVTQNNEVENAPWVPMQTFYGNANYCWLNVAGGNYAVENADYGRLTFEEGGFTTPLYRNRNAMIGMKVKNDSEFQLTKCIEPVLVSNNVIQYNSDFILVTVDPGQEIDASWLVKFYKNSKPEDGNEYQLGIMDMDTRTIIGYFGTYTMESTSLGYTLKLDEFVMPDTEKEDIVVIGSRTFKNVFVPSSHNTEAFLKYHVTSGYFDSNLRVGLTWYNPYTEQWDVINDQLYYFAPFLANGETSEVPLKIDLTGYPNGGIYRLMASYVKNSRNQLLGSLDFTFDTTGINSILSDEEKQQAEFFNLQGVKIDTPRKGEVVIMKLRGESRKVVY